MPTLTIQLPGLPSVDHILRDEMMTIGRMKGNTIALDDASVSISHAKITRKGSEFFLKDLNSTNGTMLNGQSINEARLKDGDQIKFGEVMAIYRSEPDFVSTNPVQAAAPASPPSPAPPAVPSTMVVSKSPVTQASQLSKPQSEPAESAQTSQTSRAPKNKISLLIPVAGGIVVLTVVVFAIKFFVGGNESPKPSANVVISKNSSIADLKRALKSTDPVERRRAAAALHGLGSGAKDAVPELRNALSDSDQEVRMWSALALINNKSYDKPTIPILIQVLHHENPMLRQVSCLSLALIPYEDADKDVVVAALAETASKDGDEEVRNSAKSALKIISPESPTAGK